MHLPGSKFGAVRSFRLKLSTVSQDEPRFGRDIITQSGQKGKRGVSQQDQSAILVAAYSQASSTPSFQARIEEGRSIIGGLHLEVESSIFIWLFSSVLMCR